MSEIIEVEEKASILFNIFTQKYLFEHFSNCEETTIEIFDNSLMALKNIINTQLSK